MRRFLTLAAAGAVVFAATLAGCANPTHATAPARHVYRMELKRNPHAHVKAEAVRELKRVVADDATSAYPDLRPWAPSPRNQGNFGSCASNATTEDAAWVDNRFLGGAPTDGYAPMFQYEQIVGAAGCGPDTGTTFDDNLNIQKNDGLVPADQYQTAAGTGFSEAMYDCTNPPAQADFQLAAKRKIAGWQYISVAAGQSNEQLLIDALNNDQPVLLGLSVYDNFMFAGTGSYPAVIGAPTSTSIFYGNHAVLALAVTPQGVVFLNSWGSNWDQGGYGILSWAAFDQIVWAMVTVDNPSTPAPTPTPSPAPSPVPTSIPTPNPTPAPTLKVVWTNRINPIHERTHQVYSVQADPYTALSLRFTVSFANGKTTRYITHTSSDGFWKHQFWIPPGSAGIAKVTIQLSNGVTSSIAHRHFRVL